MKKKYVTIIPARGGSTRLPGKNIKDLGGIPLIAHSIQYAQRCLPGRPVYVSTDSEQIAEIAIQYGAEVIERPAALSGEFAMTASAIQHAACYLLDRGMSFDYFFFLQPTNPLRPEDLYDRAIPVLESGEYDTLMTVSPFVKKYGKIKDGQFIPSNYTFGQRSQDMENNYYENGLLYAVSSDLIIQKGIFGVKTYPLIVDHIFGTLDVDTIEDFLKIEYFYQRYKQI